jgi:hypothetical protein
MDSNGIVVGGVITVVIARPTERGVVVARCVFVEWLCPLKPFDRIV